jgi:hypothetical protein
MGFTWFDGIPPAYDALAQEPHAVVVVMPFPTPAQWFLNSSYMVYSTRHWHPMLNGYSGFRPSSYAASYDATRGFPSDASLIGLHERGVTHIVVHHRRFIDEFGRERIDAIARQPSLQQLSSDDDTSVYRLVGGR